MSKLSMAHKLLGVQEGCTADELRRAYRKAALEELLPENSERTSCTTDKFHSIQQAYDYITSDPTTFGVDDAYFYDDEFFGYDLYDFLFGQQRDGVGGGASLFPPSVRASASSRLGGHSQPTPCGCRYCRGKRPGVPRVAKKKIPRNSPCPCGSGKKYKKCCLQKDLLEEEAAATAPLPPAEAYYSSEEYEEDYMDPHDDSWDSPPPLMEAPHAHSHAHSHSRSHTAHVATEPAKVEVLRQCAECHEHKDISGFSKSQRKRGDDAKCRVCVERAAAGCKLLARAPAPEAAPTAAAATPTHGAAYGEMDGVMWDRLKRYAEQKLKAWDRVSSASQPLGGKQGVDAAAAAPSEFSFEAPSPQHYDFAEVASFEFSSGGVTGARESVPLSRRKFLKARRAKEEDSEGSSSSSTKDDPVSLRRRALVLLRTNRVDSAIQLLSRAITTDPRDARSYNLRAQAYARCGHAEEAMQDCNAAVKLCQQTQVDKTEPSFEDVAKLQLRLQPMLATIANFEAWIKDQQSFKEFAALCPGFEALSAAAEIRLEQLQGKLMQSEEADPK